MWAVFKGNETINPGDNKTDLCGIFNNFKDAARYLTAGCTISYIIPNKFYNEDEWISPAFSKDEHGNLYVSCEEDEWEKINEVML